MAQLDVTIPCGQEPGSFNYSFCLIYTDVDIGPNCGILCNPVGFSGGCCYQYEIINQSETFEPIYYRYTDCCTGGENTGTILNYGETAYVCSQTVPEVDAQYGLEPYSIRRVSCCDCFNTPGFNCQPYVGG
jgi:hypothetical protein